MHTADPALIAGTAVDDLLQEAVHQCGGGILHGHGGLGLVLQDHVAVGVLHPDEGAGRGVDALVGEGCEGRRHLLRGHAPVKTAQTHVAHLLCVLRRQGSEAQLVGHEVVGAAGAVLLHHPDGAGVGRAGDGRVQRRQPHIAAVGVLGIDAAVEHHHRIVVDAGGAVDGAVVQRRRIHGDGLDGGTALPCGRGPVPDAGALLGASAAHHGHHIACIGIHDGHAHLQLLRLLLTVTVGIGGGIRQIGRIGADLLRDLLIVGVLGGVDLIALAVDHVDTLVECRGHLAGHGVGGIRQTVLLHQRGGHVLDDRVREVGLAGCGGRRLLRRLLIAAVGIGVILLVGVHVHPAAQNGVAVGEHHVLLLGGVVGGLIDLALLQHGAQHQKLPGAVVLQTPIGLQRVIQRGVVGNGDQTGALRQRQLRHVLVEILQRRRHHAVAAVPEVHLVEVCLQDLVLFVALLHLLRPVDLHHLALHRVLVVAGHVLHQLLGDGRAALHAAAEDGAEDGARRAVPVHALVFVEPLVLNGDHGFLQILGDLLQIDPDAVLRVEEQRVVHGPLAAGRLLIVQLRGDLRLKFVQIDLYTTPHTAVDVGGKNTGEDSGSQYKDQQDRPDDAAGCAPTAAAGTSALLPVVLYLSGALLRPIGPIGCLSAFFHHRAPSFLCYSAGIRSFPKGIP